MQGWAASWFLALAEEAGPQLTGAEQALWCGRLEREHDNLRASLTWYEQREDGQEEGCVLRGRWGGSGMCAVTSPRGAVAGAGAGADNAKGYGGGGAGFRAGRRRGPWRSTGQVIWPWGRATWRGRGPCTRSA